MRLAVSLFLAAALALPIPAVAGVKNGKERGAQSAEEPATQVVAALITATERAIILDFVSKHSDSMPPEFATAKPLPPGIAKKLARGGSLPPGIAKRYLPQELSGQLPPRPGCQWVVVGTDIVLIAAATGIVVDLLKDVL